MSQRPFWTFLPYINNRTAWKPVGFPAILVIPFGANNEGQPLSQSAPLGVTVSILDTIRRNRVAGPFNDNVFFPNRELFTLSLNSAEIAARQLDVNDFEINDDKITIINGNGLQGEIPYIQDSLYYDFSDVLIDVENLEHGRYQLSYNASIYGRVYDSNDFLICINTDITEPVLRYVDFVHPGEVIDEMKKNSPSVWFSNRKLSEEPLFDLYKPLTDSLQNVYDEQTLLARSNFVNEVFPETVPYLGRILGWEIPYFPRSLDRLRRSVLRTTTEFQKGRGTFKSITELFDLFGFEILIRNLWFDICDESLIEAQYTGDTGITLIDTFQYDALEVNLRAPGFYNKTINLQKRPASPSEFDDFVRLDSESTIDAFVVRVGSDAQAALDAYLTQLDLGVAPQITETVSGFINEDLTSYIAGQSFEATQNIYLDAEGEVISSSATGFRRIIDESQIKIDPLSPNIELTLDGHWPDEELAIYVFISYRSQNIAFEPGLEENRSNFFDIRLATVLDANTPTNLILDYALEFLYRIKAFHSLLRRIFLTIQASETYLVGDYCYGPRLSRAADSDVGQQQVPPAIIPEDSTDECSEQGARFLGYKESDIAYRDRITAGLIEEWNAYVTYDNREYEPDPILSLVPQVPNTVRPQGFYNEYGQDAFVGDYTVARAFQIESPAPLAAQNAQSMPVQYYLYDNGTFSIDNRCTAFRHRDMLEYYNPYQPADNLQVAQDVCFKGRVNDELSLYKHADLEEPYILGPCRTKMGSGAFFTTPRQSIIARAGAKDRCIGSKTPKPIISACRDESGDRFDEEWIGEQERVGTDPLRLSGNSESVLHFWDRPEPLDAGWDSAANRVPNLAIQRTNMHFPGTRFIGMGNFDGTFISNTYQLRPWDQDICDQTLNPRLETRTDGNQYLVFDPAAFGFAGNDIPADVPAMGLPTNSSITPNEVVHAIYSQFADDDCPGLCPWDTNIAANDGVFDVPDNVGTAGVTLRDALFRSVNDCGGVLIDYADGYPCIVGVIPATPNIGGPFCPPPATPPTDYLFFLNSGIRDNSSGIRMDCDCLTAPCGPTDPPLECEISEDADELETEPTLVLPEAVGTCEYLMDGTIPTMFELVES